MDGKNRSKKTALLPELKVLNIGVSTFADDLRTRDVEVVHVDLKPHNGRDVEMLRMLEKLGA
ncbi:MAG TPA: hypothetical protein VND40_03255 [Nitrososphaerales archaeon]|nr:hypothetical protein [Nitrososphaerales archaeon]